MYPGSTTRPLLLRLLLLAAAGALGGVLPTAKGQCGIPISSFPYSEGFEGGPAWASGGTGNDWAWGTPAHPLINAAASGTKCWCVGGLSGTFYTNNERSWLESPCFDFSGLNNPRISFKIFWEVEKQYDGMVFQYSTNGGTTYSNVGSFSDVADCNTAHWFNTANITNLPNTISPKNGWSGRVGPTQGSCMGGGGSGGWVTAMHCLAGLAHAPSVRFRFFFGAGSTCNDYDGIAIDDVLIEEAPPVVAAFTADCNGTTLDFINSSTPCPHTFAWNFGEAGSPQNTSAQENPSHTYAGPGTYTVSLTATDGCGATATAAQQISVLGVAVTAVQPSCGQSNGSVQAAVTGANGPVNYVWSPGGATTQALSGLGPGNYAVTVTAVNSCPATAAATLAPSANTLAIAIAHTDVNCNGGTDGTATAQVTGGTAPVGLVWSPSGITTATTTGLAPGQVTCTATDAQGCTASQSATIGEPAPVSVQPGPPVSICAGGSATLQASATGGSGGYAFSWSPNGPDVAPSATTTYTVVATDAHGCASPPATVTATVGQAFQPSFTASVTAGCTPLCVSFTPQPAGAAAYSWTFGDGGISTAEQPGHCFTSGGDFSIGLVVTDAQGCTGQVAVPDLVHAAPSPVVSFSAVPPVAMISEPTIHFSNATLNADQFTWHFGDAAGSSSGERGPSFTYDAVDCYTVTLEASNGAGCSASGQTVVCVEDRFQLFMPNAFTPNNDGINDVLLPITSVQAPKDARLMVFDRWGAPLFTTEDLHRGWDGGEAPTGVYVWKLWITDALGEAHERAGHVLLLR